MAKHGFFTTTNAGKDSVTERVALKNIYLESVQAHDVNEPEKRSSYRVEYVDGCRMVTVRRPQKKEK